MALTKALIMAGGTGGHIMPGLAVAEELIKQNVQCSWLGRQSGIEANLLLNYPQITYYAVDCKPLRGKSLLSKLRAPWQFIKALYQSWRILKTLQPDIVYGFGGYVSAPGGIAAELLGIPVIIHEQNRIAGLTNRILSRLAKMTCESFPETFQSRKKVIYTGNPVRSNILAVADRKVQQKLDAGLRIGILGGSQGAQYFNQKIPKMIQPLASELSIEVYHQTGQAMRGIVTEDYQDREIPAIVSDFIDDIAGFYLWSDLVIARAGATTVAELAAAGVPSILIPYPYAVDDHQTENAKFLVDQNAAVLLPQDQLSKEKLATIIRNMLPNLTEIAAAALSIAQPNAAQKMANLAFEWLGE